MMKLDKPTPKLEKTLTQKLFREQNSEKKEIRSKLESKEMPNINYEKIIEINSVIGKSFSDF